MHLASPSLTLFALAPNALVNIGLYLLDEWATADEELSRGAMAELIFRIEN